MLFLTFLSLSHLFPHFPTHLSVLPISLWTISWTQTPLFSSTDVSLLEVTILSYLDSSQTDLTDFCPSTFASLSFILHMIPGVFYSKPKSDFNLLPRIVPNAPGKKTRFPQWPFKISLSPALLSQVISLILCSSATWALLFLKYIYSQPLGFCICYFLYLDSGWPSLNHHFIRETF